MVPVRDVAGMSVFNSNVVAGMMLVQAGLPQITGEVLSVDGGLGLGHTHT